MHIFFIFLCERNIAKTIEELQSKGLYYQDIAAKLNKDKKSIDNALKRIRNKLKSE